MCIGCLGGILLELLVELRINNCSPISQGIPPVPTQINLSSQINLSQINFSQESHRTLPTPKLHEKRRKWNASEDVVLCSAWLNTSKDAIVSNKQKNTTFWKRVALYFNASLGLTVPDCREARNCKQRWQKINEGVGKFVGAYDVATRHKTSGQNDNDILKNAYKIYLQDQKLNFNLEHAWLELRYDQKWCSMYNANAEGSAKRKKIEDEEATSKPVDVAAETRPIGVKAANGTSKKKCNQNSESETVSLETYQSMWSIKEKDLTLKKELVKSNMLETLFQRPHLSLNLRISSRRN